MTTIGMRCAAAAVLVMGAGAGADVTSFGYGLAVSVAAPGGAGDVKLTSGTAMELDQTVTAQAGGLTSTVVYHFKGDSLGFDLSMTFTQSVPVASFPSATGNDARAYTATNGVPQLAVTFTVDTPTLFSVGGSFQSNVLSDFEVKATPAFFPEFIGLNAQNTMATEAGVLNPGTYSIYYLAATRNGFGSPVINAGAGSGILRILIGTPPTCYANCDGSTAPPVLNIGDFGCFLTRFAAGQPWANCDHSTSSPVLNIADFTCFLQAFAAGCR